jgi:DNA repair exonuclease SbcCD nuclease subunit
LKIAIVADTHFGAKNDSEQLLEHQVRWCRQEFFPICKREGVGAVIHAGDLVDRRKFVNFKTAETMRREFLQPLDDLGIPVDIIAGNHDVMYKNTNETNALRELVEGKFRQIHVHTSASLMQGAPIVLVPWITDDNRQKTMDLLAQCNSKICVGHLELNGFKMYKNTIEMTHGDDPRPFNKFHLVLSGHFHSPSVKGNIVYTGAPYEMNWSDAGDERGFRILDTETMDLVHYVNPYRMHKKIHYDNGAVQVDQFPGPGDIVKIIVKRRDDSLEFDRFIKLVEKDRPADIQVVEDHLHMDTVTTEDEEVVHVDDTPTILRKAVAEIEGVDREALSDLLISIHAEALARV